MKKRYETKEKQTLFWFEDDFEATENSLFLKNIIEDRGSKYSATFFKIADIKQVKERFKELQKYKFYKKATHNTYAYRIKMEDGSILEWKNDDGELWGWNCILTVMKKEKIVNSMIIVTRYYGWVHLNNDRFKRILDWTKKIILTLKNNIDL